jgi:hypothetical protein
MLEVVINSNVYILRIWFQAKLRAFAFKPNGAGSNVAKF